MLPAALFPLTALLLSLPPAARAVPLDAGEVGDPAGYPPPAGSRIDGPTTVAFALPGGEGSQPASGEITWEVYRESGGLRFEFVVEVDAESLGGINGFDVSDYLGYAVDADWDSTSAGVPPASVGRNNQGDRVRFGLSELGPGPGRLLPGESSRILFVRTNVGSYDTMGSFRVDNGPSRATLTAVAPQPVPEAGGAAGGAAAWLALSALRGLSGGRRPGR
ncbi:MAG: hypothetical protein QNK03_10510 [Myxococcota bacterium]|nr:hypothetical protein [Myxococcota bacterium]